MEFGLPNSIDNHYNQLVTTEFLGNTRIAGVPLRIQPVHKLLLTRIILEGKGTSVILRPDLLRALERP